jgi:signal transduction histidine kinase/GAF domain-containing protein
MTSLQDAISLLTRPPGDLVFHLITLFALTFMLYAAVGQIRTRGSADPFPRLHWAVGGVLLGRIVLTVVSLLGFSGLFTLNNVYPPLERYIDMASLGLLAFAFVPLLIDNPWLGLLAAANAAIGLLVYAGIAPTWYAASRQATSFYSQQDTIWQIWSIAIAGLAALMTLTRRRGQWPFILMGFVILTAGHALQLAFPDTTSDFAGWVRFAQLAAYPLLAATVYREYLDLRQPSAPKPDAAARLTPGTSDPWSAVDAIRQVGHSADLNLALQKVCASAANSLHADVTAIGLPATPPNLIELVAIHHPGAAPTPGAVFALDEQPAVKRAIDRRRPVSIGLQDNATQVSGLFGLLGSFVPGPLLIQPLLSDQEVLGVFLVGNPKTGRVLDAIDLQQARSFADLLSATLSAARRIKALEQQLTEQSDTLRQQAIELGAHQTAVDTAVQPSREEIARLNAALADAERSAASAHRRAEELAAFIEAKEAESVAGGEAPLPSDEAARFASERAELQARLEEARAEAGRLTELQEALETQLKHAQQQITSLRDDLERQTVAAQGAAAIASDREAPGVIVSDTAGRIVVVSQRALRLIGRPRSALIGQPIESALNDARWRDALSLLTHAPDPSIAGEPPFKVEVKVAGKPAQVELMPFKDGSGTTLNGIIVTVHGEESRSEAQRDEVLASIAQELRTPMTSITGYTDLLLSESVGILGAMQRQFLQRVKANIERMGGLLNDLIGVSAIDTGTVQFEPEPVDAIELIEEAITGSSAQFRERGITVQLDLDDELPKIQADRDSLYQVVSHLLSNASAITPNGGSVVVGARNNPEAPDYVMISVADCGGGIDPQDRQRVFNRLYRADNPLIQGLGETGVGMAIARALVEAHGGRIWVDSEMGVGSNFTFIIPTAGSAAHAEKVGT